MDDERLADERLAQKLLTTIKSDTKQQIVHHAKLLELIKTLVLSKKTVHEFGELFKLKAFFQLLKSLCKDDHKFEASKWILETMKANFMFNNRQEIIIIDDRAMINHMLELFVTLNDSLNLLTSENDIEHLSSIITYFLDRISIHDHISYLDFLVHCRASLNNLNPILDYLADRGLKLAIDFGNVEKKRVLRQKFFNSCLAFTLTTSPAIDKPSKRIELCIKACRLAFDHMSLSLADCYLKQTLTDLSVQLNPSKVGLPVDGTSTSGSLNGIRTRINEENKTKLVLLAQARSLVELMLEFEDHIDLKHKLVLKNLVKCSFSGHPSLIERINILNTIDDDGAEKGDSITIN